MIVTLGANGALCCAAGRRRHVPPFRVEPVDTTGAGDAFIGSLACFLARRHGEVDAIARANLYAALSTLAIGTQKSFVPLERFETRVDGAGRRVGIGKKKQRFNWPEAKKRCRLNQLDIEMAKRLGFGPDALIHAIPDKKQKWKLPVKYSYPTNCTSRNSATFQVKKRIEYKPSPPLSPEEEAEEARRVEEEMYWEDYYDRNADYLKAKPKNVASQPAPKPASPPKPMAESAQPIKRDFDEDRDVPF